MWRVRPTDISAYGSRLTEEKCLLVYSYLLIGMEREDLGVVVGRLQR